MSNLLFRIRLLHEYFDDGIFRSVRLQACPETRAFLNRYRINARQDAGFYELNYFGSNAPERFTQSLVDLLAGRPLLFDMLNYDDDFAIKTDLPTYWCGQLLYDSSRTVVLESESGTKQDIQEGQEETVELACQLQTRTATQTAIIGQIMIYAKDLLGSRGKMRRPAFIIRMKARQTHWHYYVLNRSQLKVTQLKVINSQGIIFENPKQVTLRNGELALLFSSGKQAFALSETVQDPFNLVDVMPSAPDQSRRQSTNVRPLITGLPIPQTNAVTIEMQDGQPYVYSSMYVYL